MNRDPSNYILIKKDDKSRNIFSELISRVSYDSDSEKKINTKTRRKPKVLTKKDIPPESRNNFIGKGTYGSVHFVDGKAVKIFKQPEYMLQEWCVLKYLRNCNYIVRGLSFDMLNEGKPSITMGFEEINFHDYIELHRTNKTLKVVCNDIVKQLLYGLAELQDRGLIHGDIKPDNILISKVNGKDKLVIADCGFTSIEGYAKIERTARKYRNPFLTNSYVHDQYSLCVILTQIYGNCNIKGLYKENKNKDGIYVINSRILTEIIKQNIPEKQLQDILISMCSEDPKKVPNARMVIKALEFPQPPVYIPPNITSEKIINKNVKRKILQINELLKEKGKGLNRMNSGILATSNYISRLPSSKKVNDDIYAVCTSVLLSSLFSKNITFSLTKAQKYSGKSYRKLYSIISEMIKDDKFIDQLYLW